MTRENKKYKELIMKMIPLKVPYMRAVLESLVANGEISVISNQELLERLVNQELEGRKNANCSKLKKQAHLAQPMAVLENLEYSPDRNLPADKINQLATNAYIENHRNVVVMGACGTGKSYLMNALANRACDGEHKSIYYGQFEFLQMIGENVDGNGVLLAEVRKKLLKYDLIIIDDFLIGGKLPDVQIHMLFQVINLLNDKVSLMIGSQLHFKEWHICLGGEQMADAIVDRIKGGSVTIILEGESRRAVKE